MLKQKAFFYAREVNTKGAIHVFRPPYHGDMLCTSISVCGMQRVSQPLLIPFADLQKEQPHLNYKICTRCREMTKNYDESILTPPTPTTPRRPIHIPTTYERDLLDLLRGFVRWGERGFVRRWGEDRIFKAPYLLEDLIHRAKEVINAMSDFYLPETRSRFEHPRTFGLPPLEMVEVDMCEITHGVSVEILNEVHIPRERCQILKARLLRQNPDNNVKRLAFHPQDRYVMMSAEALYCLWDHMLEQVVETRKLLKLRPEDFSGDDDQDEEGSSGDA